MKSVYAKISLWSFATLVVSLAAFLGVTRIGFVSSESPYRTVRTNSRAWSWNRLARRYEAGRQKRLQAFIDRLHRYIPGGHYLVDAKGRDVLSGQDRSALLAAAELEGATPRHTGGPMIVLAKSPDGLYHWIVEMKPPAVELKSYLPYYALIFGAVALVCWLLALNIASPLRALARTVDRLGAGDLNARVNSSRGDEIGDLSRAFDRMAERIGTLLTAERRLLQDVSHELRSPLARLSFAAELVRTADDREAAVARLKKEIQRLTDLVGALLQVTRAEGDPSSTSPEEVRLDTLVDEVVEDCRVEAAARGAASRSPIRGSWKCLETASCYAARLKTWCAIRFATRRRNRPWTCGSTGQRIRRGFRCATEGRGCRKNRYRRYFSHSFAWTIRATALPGARDWGWRLPNARWVYITAICGRTTRSPGLQVCIELPLAIDNKPTDSPESGRQYQWRKRWYG